MQVQDRLSKLSQLLTAVGGQVEGRKKLHKLVYLCQAAGIELGQDFIFHYYGVYSPTLAADVERGEKWEMLKESQKSETYVIAATETADPEDDFSVAAKLAGESPRVLEVLSTIVYLNDVGYSKNELPSKLNELKGHLNIEFSRAKTLARENFDIHCA